MINLITAYLKTMLEAKIVEAKTAGKPLGDINTVFDGVPFSYNEANLPALTIEVESTAFNKENTKYQAGWRIFISAKIPQKTTYAVPQEDRTEEQEKEFLETVLIKKHLRALFEGNDGCDIDSLSLFGIFKGLNCLVADGCVLANELAVVNISYRDYSQQRSIIAYEGVMELLVFNAQIPR